MKFPELISTESELDELLSRPSPNLIEMMKRIDGDIMILGIAGKMGITLGMAAVRAIREANVAKKVYGVARFSEPGVKDLLEQSGVSTITCDLLDQAAVARLPQVKNIIFMAGRKFGTDGSEELTWAMNVMVPAFVAAHFTGSRIVAFSTGCVYPLAPVTSGGCTEDVLPMPIGEYSQSCLGRERIFGYYSKINKTPALLFRLNYAIDLRYGVIYDIGRKIFAGEPVDLTMSHFNCIWQGDANNNALLSLEYAESPANILNVTGPETIPVKYVAELFGKFLNKQVTFAGTPGEKAYLINSGKASRLFGYPTVSLEQMVRWVAHWLSINGRSLNKPTHFEVNTGRF